MILADPVERSETEQGRPQTQVAIIIDRADNDLSHRLESKQDSMKSKEEMEREGPAQVAALLSLAG